MSAFHLKSRRFVATAFAVFWEASVLSATSQPAFAQGFLADANVPPTTTSNSIPSTPRPSLERSVRLESLAIDAEIENSVAQVVVSQTFNNIGSTPLEASFIFPIPYDGAIDSLTFFVEGKEFAGELLDAAKARERYEAIARQNRDPALLECVGTGLWQTSVFPIPPGQSRTVELRYTQLLRRQDGLTEFYFPIRGKRGNFAPEKTIFTTKIIGETEIKNVYSPTFDLQIDRVANNVVKTTCVLEKQAPSRDFRLFFDQNADELSARIQSYRPNSNDDGYFLLLASPKIVAANESRPAKTIVFALDVSGSMSGQKIRQAKESLKFVLSRLNDGDKFNVVLFETNVRAFSETLQTVDAASRARALAFVDAVRPRSATNIEGALNTAFALLNQDDSANPKYLFFLSDGEPTTGVANEMKLADLARRKNANGARFFSFGLGYDVNSRLLDRFVRDGRGQGEYVKPDENIEGRVAALYNRVEAPIFTDVEFEFKLKEDPTAQYFTNQIYPSGALDLYAGEQLVVVGRYAKSGPVEIKAKGKVDGGDVEFAFEGTLANESIDSTYTFVERIWATRRIGEIVDCLDLEGPNDELMNELLELSKKHGIMTPYTSFLADDSVALDATAANARQTARNFQELASQTSNMTGFAQRSLKQALRRADNLALEADATTADGSFPTRSLASAPAPTLNFFASRRRESSPTPSDAPALNAVSEGAESASSSPREKVRNIAGKTFYFKGGRWIDAALDAKSQAERKPIVVQQFDDAYFELVGKLGREFSQYLVFDEPTTLEFRGQVYQIDAPSEDRR